MIDNTEARNRNMTPIRDNAVRSFKPDRCKAGRAQQSKLINLPGAMPPRFPPCFISTLSSINTVNFGEPS